MTDYVLTEQELQDALRWDSAEPEGEALLAAELSGLSALEAAALVALMFREDNDARS